VSAVGLDTECSVCCRSTAECTLLCTQICVHSVPYCVHRSEYTVGFSLRDQDLQHTLHSAYTAYAEP
jgi:hypothetical protein